MSHSLIRTRADEDAADLILRQAASPVLPSAATASAPATPGASAAMDSMWAEYEQYLQAARAAQEAGIDIFPHAAFVVKVSLLSERKAGQAGSARKDLLEEEERGDNDSDKLFINVCTDACVDAPEIVKQPADASTLSTALPSSDPSTAAVVPPPGSLRLPMSVGPLTPCTSHSGLPSLSVDVVIHPSTLAPPLAASHSQAAYQYAMAQAALIQRQSGTAPPVLTPAQQQTVAMRELKRTVAAFALQRIEEKYKLRVDGQAELKFPKAAYKGSLPPPAQRIRRNKDNPLHAMTPQQREESERKGKVLVQEVAHAPQSSKPAAASPAAAAPPAATAEVAASARVADTAQPATVDQASKQDPSDASQHADAQTNSSAIPAQPNQQVGAMTRSSAGVEMDTAVKIAAVTPSHTLETTNENITLQVQLPGVLSSTEVGATITSADIRITTQATDSRPAYQLHVLFPVAVVDERVQAKFNRKQHHFTLTIPKLHQPTAAAPVVDALVADPLDQPPATNEAAAQLSPAVCEPAMLQAGHTTEGEEEAVAHDAESRAADGCATAAVVDWAARLNLSNRLIDQSCLSYS